jgi:hypothetical protein
MTTEMAFGGSDYCPYCVLANKAGFTYTFATLGMHMGAQ